MYSGLIAIVGRPNVGKSTLLNRLVGKKISITSHKPKTTRYCITGVYTEDSYQSIYIDTPGFYFREKRMIDCLMNRVTNHVINDVNIIIFVVEGIFWTESDKVILKNLKENRTPVLLAINKIDKIIEKSTLLPHIQFLNQKMNFVDIVPISAVKNNNISVIPNIVQKYLSAAKYFFPKEYIFNHSRSFIASEIIREKLIYFLDTELPYSVTVKIEQFVINNRGRYDIRALVLVERRNQKKIVIGYKGTMIKTISIESRKDMEKLFGMKIYLELWVKVLSGWTNNLHILHDLGYTDIPLIKKTI